MAHGRTRHNRSFKPIVVDILKGEDAYDIEGEEEEELEEQIIEEDFQEEIVHPRKVYIILNIEIKSRKETARNQKLQRPSVASSSQFCSCSKHGQGSKSYQRPEKSTW
jgi:hypothetical protein